jgi:urease beta subunit
MKKKLKKNLTSKGKTKAKRSAQSKAVKRKTAAAAVRRMAVQPAAIIPGEIILGEGDILAFHGRQTLDMTVANTGDRPIQVGSHCHFFEANRALRFNREQAFGGNRVVYGLNGLTQGRLDDASVKAKALAAATEQGFIRSET